MLIFQNVWKQYSKELFKKAPAALRNVSFSLKEGQTLGLIGANGAGKSTSIRLMMDFIRPDRGDILIFDKKPGELHLRKRIGYLPETASFPFNLTILDLISFTGETCGISKSVRNQRAESLLKELGLWDARGRKLSTYSKGMQQRANFVLALLNDPDLLILDEPMSGLDPIGRGQIAALIRDLQAQGKTILFCSHILADVDKLVDQMLVLHKGEVLFAGLPGEFLNQESSLSVEEAFLTLIHRQQQESYVS